MKHIIVSLLMLLFATSAFAVEKGYVLRSLAFISDEFAEPCVPELEPDEPVPVSGYCEYGLECPIGFDPEPRYCFEGGFHRCGIACKNNGTLRGP